MEKRESLMEMNLIQMTLPDKPNSRNQRYMKVLIAGSLSDL